MRGGEEMRGLGALQLRGDRNGLASGQRRAVYLPMVPSGGSKSAGSEEGEGGEGEGESDAGEGGGEDDDAAAKSEEGRGWRVLWRVSTRGRER